ncbi:hypothetical protein Hamer_G029579, partial [Homarus americanus]
LNWLHELSWRTFIRGIQARECYPTLPIAAQSQSATARQTISVNKGCKYALGLETPTGGRGEGLEATSEAKVLVRVKDVNDHAQPSLGMCTRRRSQRRMIDTSPRPS